MTITTLRPHRAKVDEMLAIHLEPLSNGLDTLPLSKAIVTAVLVHIMYPELPYTKDGMPTSETADILRFNRRLKDIIEETI